MSSGPSSNNPLQPGRWYIDHDDLPTLGETPGESRLDPREWFDEAIRARPLELEIGSGKGTFLVQQASQITEVNYLGIEWAAAYCRHAADRARRHGLDNVRLLRDDATVFVAWRVPDQTFRQVHIYFPDPWPKRRHHKRRSIQAPFLRELHRVLTPGGIVRIATDHDGYWAWMQAHFEQVTDLFEQREFERPVSADAGEIVGTNFERKYRREGRSFNATTLVRLDA